MTVIATGFTTIVVAIISLNDRTIEQAEANLSIYIGLAWLFGGIALLQRRYRFHKSEVKEQPERFRNNGSDEGAHAAVSGTYGVQKPKNRTSTWQNAGALALVLTSVTVVCVGVFTGDKPTEQTIASAEGAVVFRDLNTTDLVTEEVDNDPTLNVVIDQTRRSRYPQLLEGVVAEHGKAAHNRALERRIESGEAVRIGQYTRVMVQNGFVDSLQQKMAKVEVLTGPSAGFDGYMHLIPGTLRKPHADDDSNLSEEAAHKAAAANEAAEQLRREKEETRERGQAHPIAPVEQGDREQLEHKELDPAYRQQNPEKGLPESSFVTSEELKSWEEGQFSAITQGGTVEVRRATLAAHDSERGTSQEALNRGETYFLQGEAIRRGEGSTGDIGEAAAAYLKAARMNHPAALHRLGVMHATGEGVPKDEARTVEYFRRAAELGFAEAQYDLGVRYILGRGVAKDETAGMEWYRKAAGQGYRDAVVALQKRSLPLETEHNPGSTAARRSREPAPNVQYEPTNEDHPPVTEVAGGAAHSETNQSLDGERHPETRMRLLKEDELRSWSEAKLRYAINEMYARHGAVFGDKEIARWFTKFEWYHPRSGATFAEVESAFSPVERQNLELLGHTRNALRPKR